MAADTHNYTEQADYESRHSALKEFSRDERRPAVLLLSALVIAALFFAIGIMVGRWTVEPKRQGEISSNAVANSSTTSSGGAPTPQTTPLANANLAANLAPPDAERRFTLLVATYDTLEKAQPLIKSLQEGGYTDVRTLTPRGSKARYSVLAGRFTLAEAREAARQMRAANDRRLKYTKVIEDK